MAWGPFWAQAKQHAGLVVGIMTVLCLLSTYPHFFRAKNLIPLQWRPPEVLGFSQILFSAKLTQAKKEKNQSVNYTGKKSLIWILLGQSWRRFQLSCSERFYWLRLLPHHLCSRLSQTDNYLGSVIFFFSLLLQTVSWVHLFPFCSAFRKENFRLLKTDSPVFFPWMYCWVMDFCTSGQPSCAMDAHPTGFLWLREGGGRLGVPLKHGLKAHGKQGVTNFKKNDLNVLHTCSWCKLWCQKWIWQLKKE